MPPTTLTVEAVYEDGVLRLVQALPLAAHQRVTVVVQLPTVPREWPADVAEIYREIAADDRRLAAEMWKTVEETWPADGVQP